MSSEYYDLCLAIFIIFVSPVKLALNLLEKLINSKHNSIIMYVEGNIYLDLS